MRAFLTLLGVIFGVATVVAVVSVVSGMNYYVREKLFALNPDVIIFDKYGIIMSREEWLIAMKRRDITMTDMEVVKAECRLCEQVGGQAGRNRPVKNGDKKLSDVGIQGHTPVSNGLVESRDSRALTQVAEPEDLACSEGA
jgi:putative ABC transport system permease protein